CERAVVDVRFWPKADIGHVRWVGTVPRFKVLFPTHFGSAEGASANGFVDTEGDQNERDCHKHPPRMRAARYPKVGDSAIQVEAANKQAGCEPCVLPEPACCGHQGQSAEEPADRAEMQERWRESSDRSGYPRAREKKLLKGPDHKPWDRDAVNHRYAASDAPRHAQSSVLPFHDHTPLYGR